MYCVERLFFHRYSAVNEWSKFQFIRFWYNKQKFNDTFFCLFLFVVDVSLFYIYKKQNIISPTAVCKLNKNCKIGQCSWPLRHLYIKFFCEFVCVGFVNDNHRLITIKNDSPLTHQSTFGSKFPNQEYHLDCPVCSTHFSTLTSPPAIRVQPMHFHSSAVDFPKMKVIL